MERRSAKKDLAMRAADFLATGNLMSWNATFHCARVGPDAVLVSLR